MKQLSQDEVLAILGSGNRDQMLLCLQGLSRNPAPLNSKAVADMVRKLKLDSDVDFSFWSRKVLTVFSKLSPEQGKPEVSIPPATLPDDLSLEDLLNRLADGGARADFQNALGILKSIFSKRDPECVQPMIEYLGNCQDVMQISFLVKNLGVTFPREELLPVLGQYIKHPDERTVANAIEGIEAINSPKGVVLFSQLLDHPSHRVQANASRAISRVDPERSAEIFLRMLKMQDRPNYIIAACHAVKTLKSARFIPDLLELLKNEVVQEDALDAILGIGSEEAISGLEAFAINASDSVFREKILAVIRKTRPQKAEVIALPTLEESPSKPDPSAQIYPTKGDEQPASVALPPKEPEEAQARKIENPPPAPRIRGIPYQPPPDNNEEIRPGKIVKPPAVPRMRVAAPPPGPPKAEDALFHELEKSLDAPKKSKANAESPPPDGISRKKKIFMGIGGLLLAILGMFLFQPRPQKKLVDCFLETRRMASSTDPDEVIRSRKIRREAIQEALDGQREFHSWTGVVEYSSLSKNADSALFSVILEKPQLLAWRLPLADCTLRTWRNGFADTFDHTLVPRSSPLFDNLQKLKNGDRVSISGEFLADDDDFIKIGNADAAARFREPACIVRFREVKKP